MYACVCACARIRACERVCLRACVCVRAWVCARGCACVCALASTDKVHKIETEISTTLLSIASAPGSLSFTRESFRLPTNWNISYSPFVGTALVNDPGRSIHQKTTIGSSLNGRVDLAIHGLNSSLVPVQRHNYV